MFRSASNKHKLLTTPANYESVVDGYQSYWFEYINQFCIHSGYHLLRTTISPSSLNPYLKYTFFQIILRVKGATSYFNQLLLFPLLSRHLIDLNIATHSSCTQPTNCVDPLYFLHRHYWRVALLRTTFRSDSHAYKLLATANLFAPLTVELWPQFHLHFNPS